MAAFLFMFGASPNRKERSNIVFREVVAIVIILLSLFMQLGYPDLAIVNRWFTCLDVGFFYTSMLHIFCGYLLVDQRATMFGFPFDKTVEEVEQELDAGKGIELIDVRETDEYQNGHIPGADHLTLSELEDRAAAVVAKGKPHYLHYRNGQRSGMTSKKLRVLGYGGLYNIGGTVRWPYEQKTGSQR